MAGPLSAQLGPCTGKNCGSCSLLMNGKKELLLKSMGKDGKSKPLSIQDLALVDLHDQLLAAHQRGRANAEAYIQSLSQRAASKTAMDAHINREFSDSLSTTQDCPLCKAEEEYTRLHEDAVCWATYCNTCDGGGKQLMVVLKGHHTLPTPEESLHMQMIGEFLAKIHHGDHADDFELPHPTFKFRESGYYHLTDPRAIPDHYHFHVRPGPGFGYT